MSHKNINAIDRLARLILVVIAVALIAGSPALAKVENGFKVGMNIARLTGSDDANFEIKTGFYVGYYLAIPFGSNFSFQTELNYTQKGGKGTLGGEDLRFSLNYFEIPLLLRYRFTKSSQFIPYLVAGPTMSIRTKGEVSFESGSDTFHKAMANHKKADFGLAFGGGGSLAVVSTRILFEVRYTFGLSPVFDDVPPFTLDFGTLGGVEYPMAHEDGHGFDLNNGTLTFMVGARLL